MNRKNAGALLIGVGIFFVLIFAVDAIAYDIPCFPNVFECIANPFQKNVYFSMEMDVFPGLIPTQYYIADIHVTTFQTGQSLRIQPRPLAWYCAPPVTPPYGDLYIELSVPQTGYKRHYKVLICNVPVGIPDFLVGFDTAGSYGYNIRVLRDRYPDGPIEFQKSGTVQVI